MELKINLDRWYDRALTLFTLITDQELQSGQEITLTDSAGGTFSKQAQVVSTQPVNLSDANTLPSIIAWHTCGTNAINALRQLQTRYPNNNTLLIVVARVKEG